MNSRARLLAFLIGISSSAGALAEEAVPGGKPPAPTNDEIFEKVFKKKPSAAKIEVPIPVYYENTKQPMGQIKMLPAGPGEEPRFEREPLQQMLGRLVEGEVYRTVEIKGGELVEADDGRWISPSQLSRSGIQIRFNEQLLEARIHVPPELRKMRGLSLRESEWDVPDTSPPFEASALSAYSNINASESYYFSGASGNQTRAPLRAQFTNAVNLAGNVLESSFAYTENQSNLSSVQSWTRGDIRLVHDYPGIPLRQQLLDLTYTLRGFQGFIPLAGASWATEYSMQPSRLTIATGTEAIFLKRPSRVSIIVNGQTIRTLELPAGRHEIRDFPFRAGSNQYTFEITDDLGQTETITGTYYSIPEIVRPGVSRVSYSFGFPWTQQGFGRRYDTATFASSLFHVYGLTEYLTVGANFQSMSGDRWLAGGETVLATDFGLLRFEPAIARSSHPTPALGFRASYYFLGGGSAQGNQRAFSANFERRFPGFSPPSATPLSVTLTSISAGYGQALSDSTGLDFTFQKTAYATDDPALPPSQAIGLGLSKRIGDSGNLRTVFQQTLQQNRNETSLSLFLSWSFKEEKQTVSASYNPSDDSTRLNWGYSPGSGYVGDWSADASMQKAREKRTADAGIQYIGNRGTLDGTISANWADRETAAQTSATVNLGTALVFAGGRVAIGRPVANGFAIISPEKSLKGEIIHTGPSSESKDKFRATTDWLGASVYPDLSAYSATELVLGTHKVKLGKVVDRDHFKLLPGYKTGYTLILGTDASISLMAKLFDPKGAPLAQIPGFARSLDDTGMAPIPFFTSRSGKTRIEGFKPGKYTLALQDETWEPLEIEIRESQGEVIDLGSLTLKPRKP